MKDNDIDKLVKILDEKITKGVSHINIKSDEKQDELFKEQKSTECGEDTPCKIPNLNEIDNK